MTQNIIIEKLSSKLFKDLFERIDCKKPMLVCGKSFNSLDMKKELEKSGIQYISFSNFSPNPIYEDICKGIDLFTKENCDCVLAIGGGSAIDVAKCIKLYSKMSDDKLYLEQEYKDTGIPLIAIPTTAGTGSESTHFAVIYYGGVKQSVHHESILPDITVLDFEPLKSLPQYQKKCTMLDALCQAIESWWSSNSTEESAEYSRRAIAGIMKNYRDYIFGDCDDSVLYEIMLASNYAGRAINITSTTAPHAMCYKITALYNLPHGHSVALSLPFVWEYMCNNPERCTDKRGFAHLFGRFEEIADALGAPTVEGGIERFKELLREIDILPPKAKTEDIEVLTAAVNTGRLKNNPIHLDSDALSALYKKILL